jgi:hypothetical protein
MSHAPCVLQAGRRLEKAEQQLCTILHNVCVLKLPCYVVCLMKAERRLEEAEQVLGVLGCV